MLSHLNEIAQGALLEQSTNLPETSSVAVVVVIIMGMVIGLGLKLPPGNPLAGAALEVNFSANSKRVNGRAKSAFFNAKVPESSDHHVPTDAGEAVQKKNAHCSRMPSGEIRWKRRR